MRKLGEKARRTLTGYLDEEFNEPVRDPLWQHIYLASGFSEIITHPAFLKLDRIKQLGPTHMVYPGATHTRLNHSLGVFHLGRRIIRRLIAHSDCPAVTLTGVKAFLCAALLHDLGHFPYAHSLKELPLKEHEVLTGEIIRETSLSTLIAEKVGTSPELAAAIVDETIPAATLRDHAEELTLFRHLLSGVLDPDKLDYLNRDAWFCGIPYGLQDLDFVISQLRPHPRHGLAVAPKGVSAVENILFSKYLMYKTVYWHNRVRTVTAAMKKGVFTALNRGDLEARELYNLDDRQFIDLFGESNRLSATHPARRIVSAAAIPGRYIPAAEITLEGIPSDGINQLFELKGRTGAEKKLAAILSQITGTDWQEEEVILDISPAISFEVDLPVAAANGNGWINFPEAGTLFTGAVVDGFRNSLRRMLLVIPCEKKDKLIGKETLLPQIIRETALNGDTE